MVSEFEKNKNNLERSSKIKNQKYKFDNFISFRLHTLTRVLNRPVENSSASITSPFTSATPNKQQVTTVLDLVSHLTLIKD